jgi:hypothetical protein
MVEATASDFKFGALLQHKIDGTKTLILNNSRGDEFDSVTDGTPEETVVHSRDAHCYYLVDDGSHFKPTPEFMNQVHTYE